MASKERLFLNEDRTLAVIVEQHDNGNLELTVATRETYGDQWPVPKKMQESITAHDHLSML